MREIKPFRKYEKLNQEKMTGDMAVHFLEELKENRYPHRFAVDVAKKLQALIDVDKKILNEISMGEPYHS